MENLLDIFIAKSVKNHGRQPMLKKNIGKAANNVFKNIFRLICGKMTIKITNGNKNL